MPVFRSEEEAVKQHLFYPYDTDSEQKYDIGGHALFLYRAIKEITAEGSIVLDIGCNSGAIGRLLMQDKNVICYGVDISPEMAMKAITKGIFAKVGRAEELPWGKDYFDVVVLLEILEHVYDAGKVLDEAVRVLRPGGIAVGSVPHPKGQAGAKGYHRHKYHTRLYNQKSLKELLRSRLKRIKIKNIYTDPDISGLPNWMFFEGTK